MQLRKSLAGIACSVLLMTVTVLPTEQGSKISPSLLAARQNKGTENPIAVWIYLRDKGPDIPARLTQKEASLPLRTIKRRLRQGEQKRLADFYDLPVRERYVAGLEPFLKKIRHRSRWLNAVSAEIMGSELESLARLPFVSRLDTVKSYVFQDPEVGEKGKPAAPLNTSRDFALDYGPSFNQLDQINVPALHDLGYSGSGVLICMLDTGFNNLEHLALDHLDIQASRDFVNGDTNVDDEAGQMGVGNHGTNTLGTIAGFFPGELIGPAFGASFILGKTENTVWERHIEEDHWVAGAEWAEGMGADIISSSLGYRNEFSHGELDYEAESLDGLTAIVTIGANIAASKGVLIVNSAGNEGREEGLANTIIAPADSPDVLAAGAVDPQGRRTAFSSYGPSADGRIKPDISAQGSQVYTAATNSLNEFVSVAGTSFSCPLIAGAAALVLEANPSWSNRDIMTALKNTAGQASNPDNELGWGIVNTREAAFYTIKNIHPPRRLAVESIENNYGFFTQFADRLTWEADPRNAGRISVYRIYEREIGGSETDFAFLTELDAQTLSFDHRGRLPDEAFLYKIISVSSTGEESDPDYTRR